ncbi:PREDICTED: pentatricopeptide repeat-containing protein At1g06145 [Nelumbo nucifera]|uniref:Pentatricopeptide repeat-containing protein At1g06145 n=1 Tax=Nelumbo nucifera TaxID=4432 RepID=A0A1U8B246_NELNU|nr:PREDICTED: pentatricopeptide repeat-containing protein At1g06145 [Nelumbo nucifera]
MSPITTLISRLRKCSTVRELESIYASMIKNKVHQDCFSINQFVSACSNLDRMDYALLAFSHVETPNVFVYNAVIRGSVQCSSSFQALQFYLEMLKDDGVFPTSFTFSSIVKACTQVSEVGFGEIVHGQIWKNGFESHLFVQTALIDFYSNLGRILEARRVFEDMPERDIFSWTTMISAHTRMGDLNSAQRLFEEMPERKTASWNTMIAGYARIGNVKSATELFNQMPKRDLITWTTMISCYSQNKQYGEAVGVFQEMKTAGVRPDEVTMSAVISACAHLGALELGKEIYLYVMQNGFDLDVYIGSSLIDMFAKSGSLDRSLVVFFKMQEKNLFCWNSVIEGLAVHGYAEEALLMFDRMEREKIMPNRVTFISLLSACTHGGLVDEGRRKFLSMSQNYSICPEIEHYGCMVDLLGRAGLLEEALELIQGMSVEPNSVIWGAILSGCKLHRNLEIARVAVNRLMVLEPENSGYYLLLINMYAETNQWSEVAKIRTIMNERRVQKKSPGSSWIEIEGKVHEFVASDSSHPASSDIYRLLIELYGQLRLAGYVPEFGFTP